MASGARPSRRAAGGPRRARRRAKPLDHAACAACSPLGRPTRLIIRHTLIARLHIWLSDTACAGCARDATGDTIWPRMSMMVMACASCRRREKGRRRVRIVSLGSGSSGNALVVQTSQTTLLLDAGFTAGALRSRMRQAQIAAENVTAILLTH